MEVERKNHVVVVGRMGDQGAKIYLTVPTTKRMATYDSEQVYRYEHKLPNNVALLASVVFSGTEKACRAFMLTLEQKIIERKHRDAPDSERSQRDAEKQPPAGT